ncbi:putative heavy metal ion transporter [Rhizodiscina lignyota]|uniref:Heavy metal ion transporter n=1 Tax=Rhizodiscina lignyota TaxID=1504668 RepID=A0A9P4IGY7_9PEZI|nr:putative heavy metal ion transporter [Rhizodiscina lignyota]
MSSHNYKFNVTMSCGGCSGAIDRVLKKLEGVKDYEVSLDNQTAVVNTVDDTLNYQTVLKTIKKTGKKVNTGEADGEEMPVELQE